MVQQVTIIHPAHDNSKLFDRANILLDQLAPHRNTTIVLNYASEWWGSNPTAMYNNYHALRDTDYDFWILSHEPSDHLVFPRLVYYPWWYTHGTVFFDDIDITQPRARPIGCLNGTPRPHRIANYFKLKENFDKEKIFNTIFVTDPISNPCIQSTVEETEKYQILRNSTKNSRDANDRTINLPALTDAYIHIIAETSVEPRIFFSEKTWKPIAAGQLFLHFGNPGSVSFLRSLGVDTFDDIIDHDKYDNIPDWRKKLDAIHVLAQELVNQDLASIWKDTEFRRWSNKQKFFNNVFNEKYKHLQLDKLIYPYVSRSRVSSLDGKSNS